MHRTAAQARTDVQRVLRDGEVVLTFCTSKQVRPHLLVPDVKETHIAHICTTNARLIWMSANNDEMLCVRWKYLTAAKFGRKRLKHTLAFSFKMPSWSEPIDYPDELVSKETLDVIKNIQEGTRQILEVPDEFVVARKIPMSFDSEHLRGMFEVMGSPEFELICPVCGMRAGFCLTSGDELKDECEGCLRLFSGIE